MSRPNSFRQLKIEHGLSDRQVFVLQALAIGPLEHVTGGFRGAGMSLVTGNTLRVLQGKNLCTFRSEPDGSQAVITDRGRSVAEKFARLA